MTQVSRDPFPKPQRLYGKKRTPKQDLEGAVLKECLAWLRAQPDVLYIERRNTGAIAFDDGSRIKFGSEGAADIWILARSPLAKSEVRHIEIECKRRDGKGRMSPGQLAFQEQMLEIGVLYFVVLSAEELERIMRSFGFCN